METTRRQRLGAASAVALLAAAFFASPGQAKGNNADLNCSMLLRTEDGRFTYQAAPGLSVIERTAAAGPFDRSGLPDNVVGLTCIRRSQVLEVDDVEVLQAGLKLYIGAGAAMRVMTLELAEGRVTYEMSAGALTRGETRDTDAAVAAMQARIDGSQG